MNCPVCNAPVMEGMSFCSVCGSAVSSSYQTGQQNAQSSVYAEPSAESAYPDNSVNNYQQNYQQSYQNPPVSQSVYTPAPERVPTKGEYFVWLYILPLSSLIPLLYPILVIVFACGKSYPARANFFKAIIIMWVVVISICVVAVVVALIAGAIFGFSAFELVNEYAGGMIPQF